MPLTLPELRQLVAQNAVLDEAGAPIIDPELVALIDGATDEAVFVVDGEVFYGADLRAQFDLDRLGVPAETLFARQVLEWHGGDDVEGERIICHDAGAAAGAGAQRTRETKVFLPREAWSDFTLVRRLYRAASRLAAIAASPADTGAAGAVVASASPFAALAALLAPGRP